jgi:type II secretory pathway component PulF
VQFNYVVKTKEGETQTGVADAPNQRMAIDALQNRGLIILSLQPVNAAPIFTRKIKIFQRVKGKELVTFSRQLSILFSAQVPLLESLHALAKQSENEYFQQIIYEIADDVEGGTIFSKALERHSPVFSVFFINMVKSGEASGSLESALEYLANYLEKQFYLMSKVRGAMIYPAFITGAFFVIGALLMIMVIPQLTSFLTETGQTLPITTRMLIASSGFLSRWWWLLLALIIGGSSYLAYSVRHSAASRRAWDIFKLKVPLLGKKVFQKIYLTRFAENLSTLIQGGLTILQALEVSSEVAGNVVYRDIISAAKEDVRIGNALSDSLASHKEIPVLMTQMISTGEKTGSIDSILKKIAQFYSKEIDNTVENMSQLIEPILILVIGGAVAILVSSILLPIYGIANSM